VAQVWKKGRGKLGPMAPLLGAWKATIDKPMPIVCTRTYAPFGEKYVRLDADWTFGAARDLTKLPEAQREAMKAYAGKGYKEVCFFGPDTDGVLTFWSYTSDGKKSSGKLADASDVHPHAVCFEAQMDAGLARQIFWPNDEGGMNWAVEARNKKGWNRFSLHHYRPA
jgi:hypothetical protein